MLHIWLKIWFHWVESWGYVGIVILMALESSIVPVPSEIVIPPAAFWAAQGKLHFGLVVAAGTLGSYLGSWISYLFARVLGRPLLYRYGKYMGLTPSKIKRIEQWIQHHGAFGIFFARLLPVVRHLISLPAGALRMPFLPFSLSTLLGAALWCMILGFFGQKVLGDHPELLQSPEQMIQTFKAHTSLWVFAIGAFVILYGIVQRKIFLKNNLFEQEKH